MPIITQYGLRKHLDEIAAVGNDRYEAIKAFLSEDGPGEKGVLLKDGMGFYLMISEIDGLNISHPRRISDGNAVVIGYKKPLWRVYDVVLK